MNIRLAILLLFCHLIFSQEKNAYSQSSHIAGGYGYSLVICEDSTVWGMGEGTYGCLGVASSTYLAPFQIPGLKDIVGVTASKTTDKFSFFLDKNGNVWSSGFNYYGQLGDGTSITQTNPHLLNGLSGITKVVAGDEHTLFLKNDGTVWACGDNFNGQLGNGTTTNSKFVFKIPSLSGIIDISAGMQFSLFVKSNGTVWGCGYNGYGQLGLGNLTTQLTPVQIPSLTNIKAVSASIGHSLFLKNDGTVFSCGLNDSGELGIGSYTNEMTPVQIATISGISAISAGSLCSMFLKNDGTVWGCGYNIYGLLGNGSFTTESEPIQSNLISSVDEISIGEQHSLFYKNDKTIYGAGNYGAYGNSIGVKTPDQFEASPIIVNACDCTSEGSKDVTACYNYTWDANGVTYLASGSYNEILTNIAGCDSTATLNLTIISPEPLEPTEGDSIFCLGGTSQLTNSTNGGSWSSANPAIVSVDQSGLLTGNLPGTTMIKYKTTFPGCPADSVLIPIEILDPPTVSGELLLCKGTDSQLEGTDTPDLNSPWLSSDISIASIDVSGLVSALEAGTVTITYTTSEQCMAEVEVQVNLPVPPTFTFNTQLCIGDVAPVLPPISIEGILGDWQPAVIDNQLSNTYQFTPSADQCASPTSIQVDVMALKNPLFSFEDTICQGTVAEVLPMQSENIPTINGVWTPTDISTGEIGIVTSVFEPAAGECAESKTIEFVVIEKQTPIFPDFDGICAGEEAPVFPFSSINNPTIHGSWSPAFDNKQTTTYTFTPNLDQCASAIESKVIVFPLPEARFIANPNTLTEASLFSQMDNLSTNAVSYQWDFGDGATSIEKDPLHQFSNLKAREFEISLLAISAEGCIDTAFSIISINEDLLFYMPNAFTPDQNAINEVFAPVFYGGLDQREYKIEIYDRYGHIVFETNDAKTGWNGQLANGQMAKDDVYCWKIQYKEEGSIQRKSFTGHVSLLK